MASILKAAGAVIDGAIAVLTVAKRFTEKNTPESALFLALAADYQGYALHALPPGAAFLAAITALTTFMVTESAKDAHQTVPSNAPVTTP